MKIIRNSIICNINLSYFNSGVLKDRVQHIACHWLKSGCLQPERRGGHHENDELMQRKKQPFESTFSRSCVKPATTLAEGEKQPIESTFNRSCVEPATMLAEGEKQPIESTFNHSCVEPATMLAEGEKQRKYLPSDMNVTEMRKLSLWGRILTDVAIFFYAKSRVPPVR